MSTVDCPRCEEKFRIPDVELPAGVGLRCPWCNETFALEMLGQRVPPMAVLIGADNQPIELASFAPGTATFGTAHLSGYTGGHREVLPAASGEMRIEPLGLNGDYFEETFDGETIEIDAEQSDFDDPLSETGEMMAISGDASDINYPAVDFDSDDGSGLLVASDGRYESAGTNDSHRTFDENVQGVPVTGPVAPRPMSSAVRHEYSQPKLTAKPRAKPKGSMVRTGLGIILGGLLAVPLAGLVLTLFGQKPDWGFWPFNGNSSTLAYANQGYANQAMDVDDIPVAPRDGGKLTGRSLAADLAEADDVSTMLNDEPVMPKMRRIPEDPPVTVSRKPVEDHSAFGLPADLLNDIPPGDPAEQKAAKPKPPVEPTPNESAVPEISLPPISPEPAIVEPVTPEPAMVEPITPEPAKTQSPADSTITAPAVNAEQEKPKINIPRQRISFAPAASEPLVAAIANADSAITSVTQYPDPSDASGLLKAKANLYAAISHLGTFDQDSSQLETAAVLDRVQKAGLMQDMERACAGWLRYSKRTSDGMLAVGKLVRDKAGWWLELRANNSVLLKVPGGVSLTEGDEVIVLAKIVDANAPAIVKVVYVSPKPTT